MGLGPELVVVCRNDSTRDWLEHTFGEAVRAAAAEATGAPLLVRWAVDQPPSGWMWLQGHSRKVGEDLRGCAGQVPEEQLAAAWDGSATACRGDGGGGRAGRRVAGGPVAGAGPGARPTDGGLVGEAAV